MTSSTSGQPNQDSLVDEIFDRALDLPTDERPAYLDEVCGDDADLRARVERLLAFADEPPSILDGAPAAVLLEPEDFAPQPEPSLPERVGPYRILEEVGRGGMGVVYLGVRADGHFEQEVAVKVMRPGSESPEARRRFEQERQIIASLQHTNIARLYDGGVTDDGSPYSAMELVEGQPIHVYCDENRLGIVERLRLMEVVADAVHYAHQKLVVHCDLKPSNILVAANGEIKLLDFGIANLLDTAGTEDPSAAGRTRAITPLYASPEQLRGEKVSTASDVYQLGLLLFELLTGERARNVSSTSGSRDPAELASMPPPQAPSTVVRRLPTGRATTVAAARGTHPRALMRSLRQDLDLIVRAATCSEPERRYPSAAALAEDLRRYRHNEPLKVRPGTWPYRATSFVRRHRLGVGVAAFLILLLIGYSVTVTIQAEKIRRERDRAERIQAFALGLYGAGDPNLALGPELSAADLVAHGVARAEDELAQEPDLQSEVKTYLGRVYETLGIFDQAEALFRDVLSLRRSLHGEAHLEVAEAMENLGRVLLERDAPEALPLLEGALEQRHRFLGHDHPDNARTLASLGRYLLSAGLQKASEGRFREALELERRHDPGSVVVADVLLGLGDAVRFQNRFLEAEPMVRESLEIYRRHFGDLHPEVAEAWNNLASVLWRLERFEQGDEAIHRSIESNKGLYGEIHPEIATSLGNLAGSLRRRGDLERAAELYGQAMEMREQVFGPSHPRLAQSQAQLAEVFREAGKLEEAMPLFERSLSIFEEHLPEGHPSFGRVWLGFGVTLLDAGEIERARRALETARSVFARFETSRWPFQIDVILAEIARRQGRTGDALAKLRQVEGKFRDRPEWEERWRKEMALLSNE